MPLLSGDIRFAKSVSMADVPEGGGPPTSQLLTSGASNEVLNDISEETRTTGRVEIVQVHSVLLNTDATPFLGANAILAEPPADPNVSITLLSLKDPFATRADIAQRIESGMAAGSEWFAYLLENHFTSMRSLQLLQRPGLPPPAPGRTFVLVYQEGLSGQRLQRVRIKSVSTEVRIYSQIVNGTLVDFEAQVSTCELFDALLYDFPGSPPSRFFARDAAATKVRETIYSDSGLFYGASHLKSACDITDNWISLDSVYTQIVPNSRTEVASVDQRPGSRYAVELASSPRSVQVGVTPHTQRVKIGEANVGLVYVFQCQPLPEPGTLFIDYWALGQRYTITDDGAGQLTGAGGGAVSYLTGSVSLTLQAVPDIGSCITLAHGARLAYTNRASQGAQVRAPEYAFMLDGTEADGTGDESVVPGSFTLQYTSGGAVKTVTDNGSGALAGDATGVIDYAGRSVLLRPAFMPDASSTFAIGYDLDSMAVEILSPGAPDGAGFITVGLADQPAAGTLSLQWAVARSVSNTSGGQASATGLAKSTGITYTTASVPEYYEPTATAGTGVNWPRSDY
jgi:hypothetical protein